MANALFSKAMETLRHPLFHPRHSSVCRHAHHPAQPRFVLSQCRVSHDFRLVGRAVGSASDAMEIIQDCRGRIHLAHQYLVVCHVPHQLIGYLDDGHGLSPIHAPSWRFGIRCLLDCGAGGFLPVAHSCRKAFCPTSGKNQITIERKNNWI